jgi:hypothetical protein
VTARWFSQGSPVSSTNEIDRHDITEILLKAALNTLSQLLQINLFGQHLKVEVKYQNW